MKKILVGYIIGNNKCGIDTYLINWAGMLLDGGYTIDFLTNKITPEVEILMEELGTGAHEIPSLKNPLAVYKKMCNIFEENTYDIAYFNVSEAFNSIGAIAAKKKRVPKVIVHSHSTSVNESNGIKKSVRMALHNIFKYTILPFVITEGFACSRLAAEWMFAPSIHKKGKVTIVNNAIQVEKYVYNEEIRKKWRKELNLEDKFVIGHISGFTPAKNAEFLIDIIKEAKLINNRACLLLVGEGRTLAEVKEKTHRMGLVDSVIFLGKRPDANELLQAFDVFVLPSFFEGLPIVAVEAQVAGLRSYLSDTLSTEVKLSEKCEYISLKKTAKEWAEIIMSQKDYDRAVTDLSNTEYCFDIKEQKKRMIDLFK